MTETKKPGLGVAPRVDNPKAVERWMKHVTEILQVMGGIKGDRTKLDKVVTFRDLNSAGISVSGSGGSNSGGGGGGNTGSGGTTLPPYSTPPAPTGLIVTSGFSSLFVELDVSLYAYLSHTEIWRADVDDLGQAVKVLDSIGNLAADHVGANTPVRYYWARYISTRGDPGPFNATAGTPGQAALDPAYLLEALENGIAYGHLANELRQPIDLIAPLQAASAATVQGLNDEITARIAAIQAEALSREQDDNALALQISSNYSTLSAAVTAGDSDLQGQVTANLTALNTTIARVNGSGTGGVSFEALAAEVETLVVSGGSGEELAQAAYNKAAAVETRINSVDGVTKTVETLASESSTLQAAVNNPTTGLNATRVTANNAIARLDNTGAGQTIETLTSSVSAMAATINHGTTGLAAAHQRSTELETRVVDVGGTGRTLEVLGTDFNSLSSAFNNPTTGFNALAQSVSQIQTTVTQHGTSITSLTSSVNSLSSQLTNANDSITANANAINQTNTNVTNLSGSVSAQASTLNQLSTTVNNNTAAIQSEAVVRANQVGELQAKVTLKLDVNGRVIGWTINNDGQTGDFTIVADRFTIAPVATSPTANDGSPFFHLTAPTVVNGVSLPAGTYLKRAFIGQATITSAQIESLTVEQITGNIANFIQGNFNVLQSTNFSSALQRGWRLNVNGTHEIYGGAGSLIVADKIQANAVEIIDTKSLKPNAVSIWEIIIQDSEVIIPQVSSPGDDQTVFEAYVDFTEAYPDTPVQIDGYFLGTFAGNDPIPFGTQYPYGGPRVRCNLFRNNTIIAGSDLYLGDRRTSEASWGGEWVWVHQQNNQGFMIYNTLCEFSGNAAGRPFLDYPGPGIHLYQIKIAAYAPTAPQRSFRIWPEAWLKFDAGKR